MDYLVYFTVKPALSKTPIVLPPSPLDNSYYTATEDSRMVLGAGVTKVEENKFLINAVLFLSAVKCSGHLSI